MKKIDPVKIAVILFEYLVFLLVAIHAIRTKTYSLIPVSLVPLVLGIRFTYLIRKQLRFLFTEYYIRLSKSKMFVYSRLRLWWSRLYIRKNEFHRSLNIDPWALMTMNEKQREKYLKDLTERRDIAHKRGMGLI